MSHKPEHFLWLDDSPEIIPDSLLRDIRNSGGGTDLTITGVRDKNLSEVLSELVQQPSPTLVILDHVLNKTAGRLFQKGSTVAAELRDHWPTVPIVGVTAAINTYADRLSHLAIPEYLTVFQREGFAGQIDALHGFATGHRQIASSGFPIVERVHDLLGTPEEDKGTLLLALPSDLKKSTVPEGAVHQFARWLLHRFLSRPGFVYDRLHAATYLGLNEAAFDRTATVFEPARYRGVFASQNSPRWWVSGLKGCLLAAVREPRLALPAKRGRLLPGIRPEDYSRCHYSEKDLPDVVAAPDETSEELHPARSELTILSRTDTPTVGFEPRRVLARRT
ncbi:MAG: response regulator [Planctomycetaceae bacterium]|nr:response regulator [Planctomycetaceae bacterium]